MRQRKKKNNAMHTIIRLKLKDIIKNIKKLLDGLFIKSSKKSTKVVNKQHQSAYVYIKLRVKPLDYTAQYGKSREESRMQLSIEKGS